MTVNMEVIRDRPRAQLLSVIDRSAPISEKEREVLDKYRELLDFCEEALSTGCPEYQGANPDGLFLALAVAAEFSSLVLKADSSEEERNG